MGAKEKTRPRIAVLFGGRSAEYEVSLQSAAAVIDAADRERFELVLVGLARESGALYLYRGETDAIRADRWQEEDCLPASIPPDTRASALFYEEEGRLCSLPLDAALPVLHGKYGEDGTVQGLLELAGIPVIGCGVLASALCMDKALTHTVARAAGVAVPEGRVVRSAEECDPEAFCYPLFVKPLRGGSSFGITEVREGSELREAVERALAFDGEALLEEKIDGFEVGCAVLGTGELTLGEVDEIELAGGFFDYREKYTLASARIHLPARIPPETVRRVKEAARAVYRACGCTHFARVDFFLSREGTLYLNEVNTIPGFTPHSRFPRMLEAAGLSFSEVVNRILEEGVRI